MTEKEEQIRDGQDAQMVLENPLVINAFNQIFNLTYGGACSVAEMAEIVKQHFPRVNLRNVDRDKLMPKRGTLNVDKARDLINYNPSWPLKKGYPKYIDWYKKFADSKPDLFNKK